MTITDALLNWYDKNKRDLPWRDTDDPYKTWVSEIMLQQTRVETVKGYFARFMEAFPTISTLAEADEAALLKCWEGLGYYARARNLQKAARVIMTDFGGKMPNSAELLSTLPGIGPYTAGAIASIAFGCRVAAVDGNALRVGARLYNKDEDISLPSVRREIEGKLTQLLPKERSGDFNQAIMDLGSSVCVPGTPDCASCPLSKDCLAFLEGEPEALPVKARKTPPKVIHLDVAVIRCGEKVLVRRRTESMLRGLYTYYITEAGHLSDDLSRFGLPLLSVFPAVHSRHVFTHRVWEMDNWVVEVSEERPIGDYFWVFPEELALLPFPTALAGASALTQKKDPVTKPDP